VGDLLNTNVRDKAILGCLFVFGVLSFVGIFLGKPMEGTLGIIVSGLLAVYKGNPSAPEAGEKKDE
jgi:hypothetical protein